MSWSEMPDTPHACPNVVGTNAHATCEVRDPAGLVRAVDIVHESPEIVAVVVHTTIKRPEYIGWHGDAVMIRDPADDDMGRVAEVELTNLPFVVEHSEYGSWMHCNRACEAAPYEVRIFFVASDVWRERTRRIYGESAR